MDYLDSGMVLVRYSSNWAEEIDIEGGKIMSCEDYERFMAAARKACEEEGYIIFPIGSNEEISYEEFWKFENDIAVTPLNEGEYEILKRFHFDDYGHFPDTIFDDYKSYF